MQIISHRGYWKSAEEKNQHTAFERSFSAGFGLETDIRDRNGSLVVCHDLPVHGCASVEDLFRLYHKAGTPLPLALNIKADGLQVKLKELVGRYGIRNYFVFDMSVPDTLGYLREGVPFFTRQSEFEAIPPLYEPAAGVWVDCFQRDWYTEAEIAGHLAAAKKVCLVSPELHGRNHLPLWQRLLGYSAILSGDLLLCTDYPEEARRFFYGAD